MQIQKENYGLIFANSFLISHIWGVTRFVYGKEEADTIPVIHARTMRVERCTFKVKA
jgi:hypothetical protein